MTHKQLFFLSLFGLILSCNNKKPAVTKKTPTITTQKPLLKDSIKKKVSDTIFYDLAWEETIKDSAAYFRPKKFIKKDNIWVIKDYYITGELQYKAYSLSKTIEIWDGDAFWYSKDGAITQQTKYVKGIEATEENLEIIKRKKLYETYNIEEIEGEIFVSKNSGYILNDTITDHVFVFKDSNDHKTNQRLIIQLHSEDGIYYQNEYEFEDNYLDSAYFSNNRLVLKFKDSRRLTHWERYLTFKLEELDTTNSEDYDEYYEPGFVLQEDRGFAKHPNLNKKISLKKTTSNFGNNSYLGEFFIKDSTNNYTWNSLQKATNFQDKKDQYEDESYYTMYSFLESIEDNKTIILKKGVYNFSKIAYDNNGPSSKEVKVSDGRLYITGYSNIKFIGEEGVYFASNDEYSSVVDFTNCKNIDVKNIEAIHNVKETFCEAPVYVIDGSSNLTFTNCVIDGSGKYGFYVINDSNNLKIINSTITNCTRSALSAYRSSIFMDNVRIINNNFSSSIIELDQSKIELQNCIMKKNSEKFINHFDIKNSTFKMENCTVNTTLNESNTSTVFDISKETDTVIVKNSTITIKTKQKLFKNYSPNFIDCTITKK